MLFFGSLLGRTNMFEKFCNAFLYCFASLLFASIAGLAMLVAVYTLPVDKIRENTAESIEAMYINPTYLKYSLVNAKPDFFTDFLMLNIASFNTSASPLEASMLTPRYNGYVYMDLNLAMSLKSDIAPQGNIVEPYPRYWHGYLLVLKPLLFFFDIFLIRGINHILQTILLAVVLFLLYKRLNIAYSLSFLCAVLIIDPLSTGFCFQYSTTYYALLISMIVLLMKNNPDIWKLFLWTGIATVYFDFLTYPFVTICFLMIVSLALYDMPLLQNIICCAKRGFAWGLGYFGMWISKWWIASIYTGENVILNAYQSISDRTFGDGALEGWHITDPLAGIKRNWDMINHTGVWLTLLLFAVLIIVYGLIKEKKWTINWKSVLIFSITLAPFVWYLVAREHSVVHPYIVYRVFSIAFFAILAGIAASFVDKKKAAK